MRTNLILITICISFLISCKKEKEIEIQYDLPELNTFEVRVTGLETAISGGDVTSEGGGSVSSKGVVWGTNPNTTIELDNKTTDGNGCCVYTSSISGLVPNTEYYLRAYATNQAGTNYGEQFKFTAGAFVNDLDGNNYQTVRIGSQVWMKENLKTTRYSNGDIIPQISDLSNWGTLTSGAWSYYLGMDGGILNSPYYGKYYNWFTVNDSRNVCPSGWHIPNDNEWNTLITYLGGSDIAGGKMKTIDEYWYSPNINASNESGFSGLPAGMINSSLQLPSGKGYYGTWWSASSPDATSAQYYRISNSDDNVQTSTFNTQMGLSIRCIKN
jgi:uncharacterized protein (TIGR02145 family)